MVRSRTHTLRCADLTGKVGSIAYVSGCYGTASGSYLQPQGQGINAGNVTTYTVTGLSNGTTYYYFVVTACDSLGNESGNSNELSKTFP